MKNEEAFQESVRSMRNQTLRADRAGDYWTDDEKNRLRILFDSGVGITEITALCIKTTTKVPCTRLLFFAVSTI